MSLPALYTIGIRTLQSGALDSHGNSVDGWGDPFDVQVYAIAPRTSTEDDPTRTEAITGYTILAPVTLVIGYRDRVVIDGEEWEVDGEIGNWSHGPFGWAPGISFNVKRAE